MTRIKRTRLGVAAASVVALTLTGAGMALAEAGRAPSINLSGPHSVAVGSKATFKASGYFNNTKAHPFSGANFAEVFQVSGSAN